MAKRLLKSFGHGRSSLFTLSTQTTIFECETFVLYIKHGPVSSLLLNPFFIQPIYIYI